MAIRDGAEYPINYQKTLLQAKKQTAVNSAIEVIDEIESRWVRIVTCEGYSIAELKKEMLMTDIEDLLRCCVAFINKIAELEALVRHRRPAGLLRIAKKIVRQVEER